jgi:hypothetical protein
MCVNEEHFGPRSGAEETAGLALPSSDDRPSPSIHAFHDDASADPAQWCLSVCGTLRGCREANQHEASHVGGAPRAEQEHAHVKPC